MKMEQTKTCPQCGKEVLAVARKCKHCGHWFNVGPVPEKGFRHCPVCDEIIPEGSSTCPRCNEPITGAPQATPTEKAPVGVTMQNQEKSEIPDDAKREKPKKRTSVVLIGLGAALSVLLLMATISYFTSSDSDNHGNNTTAAYSPVMTDEYQIKAIAKKWNAYHQEQNANGLATLYGNEVYYYHEYYTPGEISESKRTLFLKNPEFWQDIYHLECSFSDKETAKVTFSKEVMTTIAGNPTTYPSYLIMSKIDGRWKITTESDEVTDANLAKRSKK